MSRETFIQSEDKELEVTFREVRNWDEYADLDFEADTAPLTEQEAGTDSEDELFEEFTVADNDASDNADETDDADEVHESDEEVSESPVAEDESIDEDVDVADETEDQEEASAPESESVDTEVDAEEEGATEVESGEESDEEASDVTDEGYASDTSQEAVVTLPVIADNFEAEPAWEEPVTGDEDEETVLVDEESADEEELPIGEKGEDTENIGESLENIYSLSEAEEEEVELDAYAFTPDTSDVDTFEAISSEGESLNKAETVEELPAVYSEDTLPDTVAIETVDSGDYFSFDDVELDSDEDKEEEKEETPAPVSEESTDDDSDEELSLELDYSEDDDK